MSDLFTAQASIVTRLTSLVTAATVYYGSQIVGANSQAASLPAVIVAPGDASPWPASGEGSTSDEGGAAAETHFWMVGVRVELNTGATPSQRAETLAGQLCWSVISALKGFAPASRHSALRYAGRKQMEYHSEAGYAECWLMFSTVTAIL